MTKIKVAINGFGTIGKRVAEAIQLMPDMELIGVVKTRPDYLARMIVRNGLKLYVPEDKLNTFKETGIEPHGVLQDLLREAEVVVDATPGGVGAKYKEIYEKYGIKVIFQGGEKPFVAKKSFSSLCNLEECIGSESLRVVSCNTTALLRLICTLNKYFKIKKVRATIIRRAADPKEDKRGPVDSIKLNPAEIPSHHAEDVKTVLPWLDILTTAFIVPTTLMHVHSVYIVFENNVDRKDIIESLRSTKRILLLDTESTGIDSTAKIIEAARDLGRKRHDIPELVIWKNTIYAHENELWLVQAVHQESIVVPENIDAIRAIVSSPNVHKTIELTDEILGLGKFI
ncbi:MAG: type II glyceraldehyde-3-phosphate dehydrogenase [Staphylothermus sp.]|nr:type II glyceraldehyde-3-phosphate dehydrogenase [Staphylothermus sp.]